MRYRSDSRLLIGALLILLGLSLRYGEAIEHLLHKLPAGGAIWVVLFVGGFCCSGFYLFDKAVSPAADEPSLFCPECRQIRQPSTSPPSVCPACGEPISLISQSALHVQPELNSNDGFHPVESSWESRRSVFWVLPVYLLLMALSIYVWERPEVISQWYDFFRHFLHR